MTCSREEKTTTMLHPTKPKFLISLTSSMLPISCHLSLTHLCFTILSRIPSFSPPFSFPTQIVLSVRRSFHLDFGFKVSTDHTPRTFSGWAMKRWRRMEENQVKEMKGERLHNEGGRMSLVHCIC